MLRRRKIVLFCDYDADPVWDGRGRKPRGMIALESLPLTRGTKDALRAWADSYDRLPDTYFEWPEPNGEAKHDAEGERLWRIVQDELGADWKVGFLPNAGDRVRW